MFVDIDGTIYFIRESGGPGSGNWGHLGIPGYHGGSQAGSGGIHARPENYKEKKGITDKKTQSKTDKYIDAKTEFGATPALESALDASMGDKNWDETEVNIIKNALNTSDSVILAASSLGDPTVEIVKGKLYGNTKSGGIYGGTITKEDASHIYLTGTEYNSATTKSPFVQDYKISKSGNVKNFKGEVTKTYKTQKL